MEKEESAFIKQQVSAKKCRRCVSVRSGSVRRLLFVCPSPFPRLIPAKYFHISDFKLAAAFAGSQTLSPGFPSLLASATNFTQPLKLYFLPRSFVLRHGHVSTTTLRLFCHCDAAKLTKPLHPEYFIVTELPLDFYVRDLI